MIEPPRSSGFIGAGRMLEFEEDALRKHIEGRLCRMKLRPVPEAAGPRRLDHKHRVNRQGEAVGLFGRKGCGYQSHSRGVAGLTDRPDPRVNAILFPSRGCFTRLADRGDANSPRPSGWNNSSHGRSRQRCFLASDDSEFVTGEALGG